MSRTDPKALCLLSGGLDSTLAARMVLDLGVELEAVNFVTAFCTCTPKTAGCAVAVSAARQLGVKVKTFNSTRELIDIVKSPAHGWGSNLNPCIDCRILMFRRALEYMREVGADFLVTGEILGERPMSQRREAMLIIERESGAEGLVLRPLSAGLLEPSIPEREGWVDRAKMLSISGRSRKPQIALARELGVGDYPCPAGGCRLTEPGYAGKLLDLLEHSCGITVADANLLRHGRHFRLSPEAKAVVGRDEKENARIASCAASEDALVDPLVVTGPTTLVRGSIGRDEIALACGIAGSYAAPAWSEVEFEVRGGPLPGRIVVVALPREAIDERRARPLEPGWRRRTKLAT
ncbi:MAG: hypothetical protein ACYTKD_05815 [Planctomycetota bacterium]